MYQVKNHFLSHSHAGIVPYPLSMLPSPNFTKDVNITPSLIVIHYTAAGAALNTVTWCQRPDSNVSYHVIIGRRGGIYQLVPFNRRAWHAGISQFLGHGDCNNYSIGIGLANWGCLRKYPDGPIAAWPEDYTLFLPPTTPVFKAYHKHQEPPYTDPAPIWEAYPARQIFSLMAVIRALVNAYPIEWIAGHDDVSPTRKLDPGPAFPQLPIQPRDTHILNFPPSLALLSGYEAPVLFHGRYYCAWCGLHYAPETLSDAKNAPHATNAQEPATIQACPICSAPLCFLA